MKDKRFMENPYPNNPAGDFNPKAGKLMILSD
jgi:hypothetical protein